MFYIHSTLHFNSKIKGLQTKLITVCCSTVQNWFQEWRLSSKKPSIKLARNLISPETIFGSFSSFLVVPCCVYCFPWGYCRYWGLHIHFLLGVGIQTKSIVLTFSVKFLPMQVSFQLHICIKNNGSLSLSHEISRQRQMTGRFL